MLKVPLWRVLKLNLKEWWIIILGLLGALMNGAIWPMFALLFGEILKVFMRPADQVIGGTHLWGALFIALGVISGLGVFLKVCVVMATFGVQFASLGLMFLVEWLFSVCVSISDHMTTSNHMTFITKCL